MGVKKYFFSILWLFFYLFLFANVWGFESLDLYIDNTALSQSKLKLFQTGSMARIPQPRNWLVVGLLHAPGLSLPTVNHIALYNQTGSIIPLIIERASLVFQSDQIVQMTMAFEIPNTLLLTQPLKLVWSNEKEPLTSNQEVTKIILDPKRLSDVRSFYWKEVSPRPVDSLKTSTIIVEVNPQAWLYRVWYLLPLIVLAGLASLYQLSWRRKISR